MVRKGIVFMYIHIQKYHLTSYQCFAFVKFMCNIDILQMYNFISFTIVKTVKCKTKKKCCIFKQKLE